eukprot:PhM_4_TR9453/c0_g1_i1/m.5094
MNKTHLRRLRRAQRHRDLALNLVLDGVWLCLECLHIVHHWLHLVPTQKQRENNHSLFLSKALTDAATRAGPKGHPRGKRIGVGAVPTGRSEPTVGVECVRLRVHGLVVVEGRDGHQHKGALGDPVGVDERLLRARADVHRRRGIHTQRLAERRPYVRQTAEMFEAESPGHVLEARHTAHLQQLATCRFLHLRVHGQKGHREGHCERSGLVSREEELLRHVADLVVRPQRAVGVLGLRGYAQHALRIQRTGARLGDESAGDAIHLTVKCNGILRHAWDVHELPQELGEEPDEVDVELVLGNLVRVEVRNLTHHGAAQNLLRQGAHVASNVRAHPLPGRDLSLCDALHDVAVVLQVLIREEWRQRGPLLLPLWPCLETREALVEEDVKDTVNKPISERDRVAKDLLHERGICDEDHVLPHTFEEEHAAVPLFEVPKPHVHELHIGHHRGHVADNGQRQRPWGAQPIATVSLCELEGSKTTREHRDGDRRDGAAALRRRLRRKLEHGIIFTLFFFGVSIKYRN